MLQELRVFQFKSWEKVEVGLSPLTAFFGTNSSGKTSLLQFILMLKQTAESSDRGQVLDLGSARSFVELGTFEDVITGHDVHKTLQIGLKWKAENEIRIEELNEKKELLIKTDQLVFQSFIKSDHKGRLSTTNMEYALGGLSFSMTNMDGNGAYALNATDARDIAGTKKFSFIRKPGRPWDLPRPYKCYGFPDEANAYFQNAGFLADLSLELEKMLAKVFYLGPLRENPKRQYNWGGGNPRDVGSKGEFSVEAILASRDNNLLIPRGKGKKQFTLEEYVAFWLKELGLIAEFQIKPVAEGSKIYEVKVQKTKNSPWVGITDVGFGVSQILPVITLCYFAPKGSILLIEQPEIHLHPSVQSGLADVFLDAIEKKGVQIILESHSEHLLRRLQRRTAEEAVKAGSIKLYFCSNLDGKSQLMPLDLDDFGKISNWPKGFFGDEMEEIFATSKAVFNRTKPTANGN